MFNSIIDAFEFAVDQFVPDGLVGLLRHSFDDGKFWWSFVVAGTWIPSNEFSETIYAYSGRLCIEDMIDYLDTHGSSGYAKEVSDYVCA